MKCWIIFGKQAENFNSIDVMKLIMAIVVVAIHTEPFHSSQHVTARACVLIFQDFQLFSSSVRFYDQSRLP